MIPYVKDKLFLKENTMFCEIQDEIDIVREYEKIGYFENENFILLVDDNKFLFRDRIDGDKFFIEYTLKDNFDRIEYNEQEILSIRMCIEEAEYCGFYI